MKTRTITLKGDFPEGTNISGSLLMDVLALLVGGTKMALRLRGEGRSKAQGSDPGWLQKASYFEFSTIREGSRSIDFQAPPLSEIAADLPISFVVTDPHSPAVDLLTQSLDAALHGDLDGTAVDATFLKTITPLLKRIFSAKGVQYIEFGGGDRSPLSLDTKSPDALTKLEKTIPEPSVVQLRGRLVMLDIETGVFEVSTIDPMRTRGWLKGHHGFEDLSSLLGQDVLVSAEANYFALDPKNMLQNKRIKHLYNATISPLNCEQISIMESIQHLKSLEAGWQGQGQGLPYDHTWLDEIETLIATLYKDHNVRVPYIYGTPTNEVQLEWDLQSKGQQWGVEALFKKDSKEIQLFAVQTNGQPDENGDYPCEDAEAFLGQPEVANHIARFVKQFEEP